MGSRKDLILFIDSPDRSGGLPAPASGADDKAVAVYFGTFLTF